MISYSEHNASCMACGGPRSQCTLIYHSGRDKIYRICTNSEYWKETAVLRMQCCSLRSEGSSSKNWSIVYRSIRVAILWYSPLHSTWYRLPVLNCTPECFWGCGKHRFFKTVPATTTPFSLKVYVRWNSGKSEGSRVFFSIVNQD